jgi:hypothetical protein
MDAPHGHRKNEDVIAIGFWRDVIPGVIAAMRSFLDEARSALLLAPSGPSGPFIKDAAPLEELLGRLAAGADRTLRERDNALRFIGAY